MARAAHVEINRRVEVQTAVGDRDRRPLLAGYGGAIGGCFEQDAHIRTMRRHQLEPQVSW
jgi:hypothetical protein